MKALILATTAIMCLGLGSASAGTPVQRPVQLAQQQEMPLKDYVIPKEEGGAATVAPKPETDSRNGDRMAQQQEAPLKDYMIPKEEGGAAAVSPAPECGSGPHAGAAAATPAPECGSDPHK